ncbi:serine/threonine-protein kinase HSL1,negative regulator of Swe1 kinase [Trypanosoma cruzi]|nr:serine/threonine-protein kinase HSL1,negative regulator of Swe1 kinase [Trypanosoma cruzi]
MPSAGFSADRTYAKNAFIPQESKNSYVRCSSQVNACDFELPLFAAPCSKVLFTQMSMVGGKMAEKADKAKRTARASACMIRKGFLFHFPPAILTSPESGIKTAHHPWSDASVMMAADAFSEGLMIRLRLYSR